MNEKNAKHTTRRWAVEIAFRVLLVVVFGVCLFLIWGSMGTARNAVERSHCQDILKLAAQLADADGDVTGDAIKSSLKEIAAGESGETLAHHSGPTHDLLEAYIVSFNAPSSEHTTLTVVACDKPGNHVMHRANGLRLREGGKVQEQAWLLLSDGSVAFWNGASTDYEKWVAGFVDGEGDPFPPGMEERLAAWAREAQN